MQGWWWGLVVLAGQAAGRAPLVSLTVSVLGNATEVAYQATFDRSDYAYPITQAGAAGFAGELYVPAAATCADEVLGSAARRRQATAGGIAFLPLRSCRAEWASIVRAEATQGRAGAAILYSLKDDAAQAAERAGAPTLPVPVWAVNAVAGAYLAAAVDGVASGEPPPAPPPAALVARLQDDTPGAPRAFVSVSRSAADVATADRNFFLKAMIGVGITGIVCFFVAMVVRYFDCLRAARRRHNAALHHIHHHHHVAARDKRVLLPHELDAMPCSVVVGPLPRVAETSRRSAQSCPHLPLQRDEELSLPRLQRVGSVRHQEARRAMPNTGWDDDDDETPECAICLEDIHAGQVVRTLPCPHVFHAACIDRWLLGQSSTCPLCKRDTLHGTPPA
ncbi:hypothetical protein GGI04_000433 [Coemansia thaxteri]|nr:hypothetical protein GGI04_000433 [Coemansia thaxteri]KAJ2474090.1 hypothetical protein GGI02_000362 [Coemansia sp. RSA 2322]